MNIEWSEEALADLDRFAEFLDRQYPALAAKVAAEIISKVRFLPITRNWAVRLQGGRNIGKSFCRFFERHTYFGIGLMANAS